MAVREYIGARYVPIFDGAWDNTKAYEPLTVVEYQGDSYTSRQAVPVGIAITNEQYWVETGNYSAQIEAYRQEVQAYNNRIATLEGKFPVAANDIASNAVTSAKIATGAVTSTKIADTAVHYEALNASLKQSIDKINNMVDNRDMRYINIICIGDSLGRGVGGINNPPNDMRGWPYYMNQHAHFNTFINVSNSGAGFVNKGHSTEYNGMTFQDQLDYAYNNIGTLSGGLTADDIDIVFVAGGQNDHSHADIDIIEACHNFCDDSRAKFPNAKIYFAPLCTGKVNLHPGGENFHAYSSQCDGMEQRNATVFEKALYILMTRPNYYCRSTDDHPSDAGHHKQGLELLNLLCGGNVNQQLKTYWTQEDEGFSWESDITPSSNFHYGCVDGKWIMKGELTIESWNGWTAKNLGKLPICMRPIETTYIVAIVYGANKPAVCRVALKTNGDITAYSITSAESASVPGTMNNVEIIIPYTEFALGAVI